MLCLQRRPRVRPCPGAAAADAPRAVALSGSAMDASERRGGSAEHGAARAWAGAGREAAAAPGGAAGARCAACAGSGPGGTELHSPESGGKKANRYPGSERGWVLGVGSGGRAPLGPGGCGAWRSRAVGRCGERELLGLR